MHLYLMILNNITPQVNAFKWKQLIIHWVLHYTRIMFTALQNDTVKLIILNVNKSTNFSFLFIISLWITLLWMIFQLNFVFFFGIQKADKGVTKVMSLPRVWINYCLIRKSRCYVAWQFTVCLEKSSCNQNPYFSLHDSYLYHIHLTLFILFITFQVCAFRTYTIEWRKFQSQWLSSTRSMENFTFAKTTVNNNCFVRITLNRVFHTEINNFSFNIMLSLFICYLACLFKVRWNKQIVHIF